MPFFREFLQTLLDGFGQFRLFDFDQHLAESRGISNIVKYQIMLQHFVDLLEYDAAGMYMCCSLEESR